MVFKDIKITTCISVTKISFLPKNINVLKWISNILFKINYNNDKFFFLYILSKHYLLHLSLNISTEVLREQLFLLLKYINNNNIFNIYLNKFIITINLNYFGLRVIISA